MKKRLTFLLINSRSGMQRRFSIHKKLFYFTVFFILLLIGAGGAGVWKARENLGLIQQRQVLEAKHQQMHVIAKTVKMINKEEIAIRHLLGLDETAQITAAVSDNE